MTNEPAWETQEKVVTIIERHLGPEAKVRRNVRLPVLNSKSGQTRQCDIVIEKGTEPRKTISIVEVQKRNSKPKIAEFDGWYQKMRDVGAQHLICVSELGFPSTIKEKADQKGPTVRLLTLKKLEENSWPIPSTSFSRTLEVVRYVQLKGLQFKYPHLVRIDPQASKKLPNPHEKIFRTIDRRLVSVTDIMDWHLFGNPNNLAELPRNKQIVLGVNITGGFEHRTFNRDWVKLTNLLIQIELSISKKTLNWEAAIYEQRGWGEVAWVLRGSSELDGKKFDIVTPLMRIAPGEYRMGHPIILGDYDAFISLGNTIIKAERFKD